MPDKHISIDYHEKNAIRRRDPKRKKGSKRKRKKEEYNFVPEELKYKQPWKEETRTNRRK